MSNWHEDEPPDNTARALLIGAVAVVAVMTWMFFSRPAEEAPASRGFNLSDVGSGPSAVSSRPFLPREQKTGLDFVGKAVGDGLASAKSGLLPTSSSAPAAAAGALPSVAAAAPDPTAPSSTPAPAPSSSAEQSLNTAAQNSEKRMLALWKKYNRASPVMAQYGKDWNSYPDLKKLSDTWAQSKTGDYAAFLRGVATSKNTARLLTKYAGDPVIQSFAKDAIKEAGGDLLSAVSDYVSKDNVVKRLADNVGQALGIPVGMLGAASADPSKLDQRAVMDSILKNRPR